MDLLLDNPFATIGGYKIFAAALTRHWNPEFTELHGELATARSPLVRNGVG